MAIKKIAVLGAGNGGCAAAADLTLRGYEVRLFSRSESTIAKLAKRGEIELIENGSPAYRAVYCVKYLDTVFILHAFEKTTEGVDQPAMETAKARYKEMKRRVEAERKQAKRATVAPPPKPRKRGK